MSKILVEVCVDSLGGAIAAEQSGADRLELNLALELDGLTPSAGLVRSVLGAVSIPIISMIRPRSGDFCYSESEWSVMLADARMMLDSGVLGIAFGAVAADRRLDFSRCQEMVDLVRQVSPAAEIVFHKAFDELLNWQDDVEALIDIGIHRVMTSGRQPDSLSGLSAIQEIQQVCKGRIGVLPAGGVNSRNSVEIVRESGISEIHGSFSGGCPGDFDSIQAEIHETIGRLAGVQSK